MVVVLAVVIDSIIGVLERKRKMSKNTNGSYTKEELKKQQGYDKKHYDDHTERAKFTKERASAKAFIRKHGADSVGGLGTKENRK